MLRQKEVTGRGGKMSKIKRDEKVFPSINNETVACKWGGDEGLCLVRSAVLTKVAELSGNEGSLL